MAEAYLSYAESLYEYSVATGTYTDNETEILDYINRVRYRAGIPQYGKGADQIPVTEAQLRDLIRRERRVELNCEAGIRFDDLRRWKEAETALNGKFYGMNALAKVPKEMNIINVPFIKPEDLLVIGGRFLRMILIRILI